MKAAALAFLVGGCSFVFVEAPPSNYQHVADFHCTPSDVPPMLDGIFAGINALDLTLVGSHQLRIQDSSMENAVLGISAGLLALHVASAIYGFVKTSSCQEAMSAVAARKPHRFQNFLPPAQKAEPAAPAAMPAPTTEPPPAPTTEPPPAPTTEPPP